MHLNEFLQANYNYTRTFHLFKSFVSSTCYHYSELQLQSSSEVDTDYFSNESRDMIAVIQQMIAAGHTFDAVEQININLEPGLW